MSGCHNPYGKKVDFNDMRTLIKRIESFEESRTNHLLLINELISRLKKLEEEVQTIKIVNMTTGTNNNMLLGNNNYQGPFKFDEKNGPKAMQVECPNCKKEWVVAICL